MGFTQIKCWENRAMFEYQAPKSSSNDMFLNYAICEDTLSDMKACISLLDQSTTELGYKYKLSTFNTADGILFHLEENPSLFDVIFMDIHLNNKNGVEVVKKLRELGSNSKIVFFTTSEDYVFEAFDVQADNYIIKNTCTKDKFKRVLSQTIKHIEDDKNKLFFFEFKGNKNVIPMRKIRYFEVWNKIVTVHFDKDKSMKFYSNLQEVISKLNMNEFFQVHRSYIINMSQVTQVFKNNIILMDGTNIPLGKTYVDTFETQFLNFVSKMAHSEVGA